MKSDIREGKKFHHHCKRPEMLMLSLVLSFQFAASELWSQPAPAPSPPASAPSKPVSAPSQPVSPPLTLTAKEAEELRNLLIEIKQQQAVMEENDKKISEKLTVIGEAVRQTRIFSAKASK